MTISDETPRNVLSPPVGETGWIDIMAERQRQISVEGWTTEHDDAHVRGEMAQAAACYALNAAQPVDAIRRSLVAAIAWMWPWDGQWWKPKDRRRDLVKAGALIVAEIERLDRAAPPTPSTPEPEA